MNDSELERPTEMFDALFAEAEAATQAAVSLRASIRGSVHAVLDAQADDILRKAPAAGLKQSLP